LNVAKHTVKRGECISSIAYEHGFFPDTLWNLPENAQLKQERKDMNVLLPGDEVFIPDRAEKTESGATEERHRFRKKGVPAKLQLVFKIEHEPRANERYWLSVDDGPFQTDTLDETGLLEAPIPPNAAKAHVFVGEGVRKTEHVFKLGNVDPISEPSGSQSRLANLGYPCEHEKHLGETTRAALREFQKDHGLNASGELDDATQNALKKAHGS
jgi:hypothetical protein